MDSVRDALRSEYTRSRTVNPSFRTRAYRDNQRRAGGGSGGAGGRLP